MAKSILSRLVVVGVLLLIARPVAAQLSYPDLTGMFSQAAGAITQATGAPFARWAWTHQSEATGCARLYWNLGVWWDPATGWYERFCVVDGWVRLMGWTAYGTDTYLPITSEGQAGQRYALVHATEPYAFTVEATLPVHARRSDTSIPRRGRPRRPAGCSTRCFAGWTRRAASSRFNRW